jgi:hypothetical protein
MLGQSLDDVARLVNLAALDRRVTAERAADRLDQRLRAIDDEQPTHARIQPALDQVVQQRLHHRGIFAGAFQQAKRVFCAFAIDADRRQQGQLAGDVHAIDLDRQQIEPRQIRRHPFTHPLGRQRHEPTRHSRLRHARPGGGRDVALRQTHRTPEAAGRDVDQHQVHRPAPQPVLGLRRLPARQRDLGTAVRTHARPFDHDLAAVEAQLARRPAPAITASIDRSSVRAVDRTASPRLVPSSPTVSRHRPSGRTARSLQSHSPRPSQGRMRQSRPLC